MTDEPYKPVFIFHTYINSFHYLYQDAEHLRLSAKELEGAKTFEGVQLCRTALMLYVFSLEGLINRALDFFLPNHLHDFMLDREDRFSLEDKWLLLPLLASPEGATFDRSKYPWSHFTELIAVRNDYVHPKHDRPAYYRAISSHEWEPIPWNEIPNDLEIKETDVIYRQTRIPRDPYSVRVEHIDRVKKVVDDTVNELDKLLGGRITRGNWLHQDTMKLIYPQGAQLDDLRSLPKKKAG